MFTIRHIREDGHEFVREVRSVVVDPDIHNVKTVFCFGDETEDSVAKFKDGMLYVMNEMGRTVAKYDLGPPLVGAKAVEDLVEKFPDGVLRG